MLLNILQHTGQPHNQDLSSLSVSSAEAEDPCSTSVLLKLFMVEDKLWFFPTPLQTNAFVRIKQKR